MHIFTKLILFSGSILYLAFLIRRTIRSRLDLFDLIYLITVVAIPCLFAISDKLSETLTSAIGIKYPFILMFGLIHGSTFLYTTIQAGEINRLKQKQLRLVQEVSLLKDFINQRN
jgi:hypothetical protein